MKITPRQLIALKVALHLVAFLPLVYLVFATLQGGLSADPAKDIQHFTGRMALKLLLGTLLVSPLARLVKQPLLMRTRRLLGIWTFAWATLHLLSYYLLELGVDNLRLLGSELLARPFLLLGILSWLILLALAVTSFLRIQRQMGRRWQTLHNLVLLVAILAPLHYILSVKVLSPQPLIYAALALLLLAWRYKKWRSWFSR